METGPLKSSDLFSSQQRSVTIRDTMPSQSQSYDPKVRAAAKRRSRVADEKALVLGRKSQVQLKRENEVFAPLAQVAQLDLSASRSLS
jgi:hypothetical protein